jgi:ABC-type transporter Mla subunit MlaD
MRGAGHVATAARGAGGTALAVSVRGFSRVARAAAARQADLVPLAARAGDTAAALEGVDQPLAELPATTRAVVSGGAAARRILSRLTPLAVQLRPAAQRLGPTLQAVRPLLREATPVLRSTRPVVGDTRRALASAARAGGGTRAALSGVDAMARVLDGGLVGALEKPTALGTPAYLAFLGLFAGGGGASRPFQGDDGHFMRFGFRFLSGAGRPVPPCNLLESVSPQLAAQAAQAGACQR